MYLSNIDNPNFSQGEILNKSLFKIGHRLGEDQVLKAEEECDVESCSVSAALFSAHQLSQSDDIFGLSESLVSHGVLRRGRKGGSSSCSMVE